jgi:hypothetical protein
MEGGIRPVAGSPDSLLRRSRDVATAHSPDARAQSAASDFFWISDGESECDRGNL